MLLLVMTIEMTNEEKLTVNDAIFDFLLSNNYEKEKIQGTFHIKSPPEIDLGIQIVFEKIKDTDKLVLHRSLGTEKEYLKSLVKDILEIAKNSSNNEFKIN